ncbi:MAG: hypothetical protein H6679_04415 [Epsilonproteobacteria bacterium]|nr:hypothetical protein [Campylobacterota bacterium]
MKKFILCLVLSLTTGSLPAAESTATVPRTVSQKHANELTSIVEKAKELILGCTAEEKEHVFNLIEVESKILELYLLEITCIKSKHKQGNKFDSDTIETLYETYFALRAQLLENLSEDLQYTLLSINQNLESTSNALSINNLLNFFRLQRKLATKMDNYLTAVEILHAKCKDTHLPKLNLAKMVIQTFPNLTKVKYLNILTTFSHGEARTLFIKGIQNAIDETYDLQKARPDLAEGIDQLYQAGQSFIDEIHTQRKIWENIDKDNITQHLCLQFIPLAKTYQQLARVAKNEDVSLFPLLSFLGSKETVDIESIKKYRETLTNLIKLIDQCYKKNLVTFLDEHTKNNTTALFALLISLEENKKEAQPLDERFIKISLAINIDSVKQQALDQINKDFTNFQNIAQAGFNKIDFTHTVNALKNRLTEFIPYMMVTQQFSAQFTQFFNMPWLLEIIESIPKLETIKTQDDNEDFLPDCLKQKPKGKSRKQNKSKEKKQPFPPAKNLVSKPSPEQQLCDAITTHLEQPVTTHQLTKPTTNAFPTYEFLGGQYSVFPEEKDNDLRARLKINEFNTLYKETLTRRDRNDDEESLTRHTWPARIHDHIERSLIIDPHNEEHKKLANDLGITFADDQIVCILRGEITYKPNYLHFEKKTLKGAYVYIFKIEGGKTYCCHRFFHTYRKK